VNGTRDRPPLRVMLVNTAARNGRGSMSRYVELVSQALGERPAAVQATRVNLSAPALVWRHTPSRLAPWMQHAWILGTVGRRLRGCSADLLHVVDGSHGYVVPRAAAPKVVLTVHDVIPLLQSLGALEGPRPSRLARNLWRRTLETFRIAARLIAVSQRTADDLIRHAGVRPDRVVVVNSAVARMGQEEPRPTTDGSPRFILHVGNGAFYKNRPAVLRVFADVRRRCRVRLKVAGAPPEASLRSLALHLGIQNAIDWVIEPDDATLGRLYSHASVLLFPSLYEGFGWPPLEAMAAGCPVVCSTAASLPEVVGDAALACPPDDEGGLADHVARILNDPGLSLCLAARGRERAALFSLDRMAAGLIEAYRGAVGDAA
jgi:glycosyltransferase involved in cell wall biosynthesis